MLRTALTRLLAIDHPIIQAGMGADAGPALAAAVSNAGALGSLGTIGAPVAQIEQHISETRAATTRPFAVNILTFDWAPFAPQMVDLALQQRVPVVTLSFGEFGPALERCKAAGIPTLVQVQDFEGAKQALAGGADAVIAQGSEAGGHTGHRGTLSLVAQVLDIAGETPVVAAGGVGNGRGLAAAIGMGAAGAVMGTAFKATTEFNAKPSQKDAIVRSDGSNTLADLIFDAPYPIRWPEEIVGRALRSRFSDEWQGRVAEVREKARGYGSPFGLVMELGADPETEINWAGESAALVRAVEPAARVVAATVSEAERLLRTALRTLA